MPLLVMLSREGSAERVALKKDALDILTTLEQKIDVIHGKAKSEQEIQKTRLFENNFNEWVSINVNILNLGAEGSIFAAKALQVEKGALVFNKIGKALDDLQFLYSTQKIALETDVTEGLASSKTVSLASLILLLLSSLGTFALLRHKLVNTLNYLITRLTNTSNKTNNAATLISKNAAKIAIGAESQAAAVEESSSALQQVNASAEPTATNATEADGLTEKNTTILEFAIASVTQLTQLMESIIASSEESKK